MFIYKAEASVTQTTSIYKIQMMPICRKEEEKCHMGKSDRSVLNELQQT